MLHKILIHVPDLHLSSLGQQINENKNKILISKFNHFQNEP